MFRKLLSGLTSTAVVAGLVTMGAVATAAPAAAAFTISPYAESVDNPTLAAQCGLDFGLVLDSSGSIGDDGILDLRNAANAFVDALVDTGSKVAVTSFSTGSPGVGGVNLEPTALSSANLATIKASYNNLDSNGWTNWRQGLQEMEDFYPPAKQWNPKLMVFITDGNPNTINSNNGGQFGDGAKGAVDPAIAVANDMKTAGTKMFGIAVGDNITVEPIQAVTNQTLYDGTNFPDAGYVQTDDYSKLAQQLKELAVDLCAPSLTITKTVDTPETQGFVTANGWTFDTTVTIPGGTGNWVQPGTGGIPNNTASTKSAATANQGAVNFQWEPSSNIPTNPVIVKETLQGGYERDPLLACVAKDAVAGTSRNINVNVDGNGNWNLGQIEPREIVTCTAKNTLTKLKLKKTVNGGTATAGNFTLTATAQNAPNYSKPGDHGSFEPINGGVVYTLGETGPANYTGGTWACTNGVQVQNGNQITVAKGTQTECTITNTRDTGKLKLVKNVSGGPKTANDWTLTATGPNGAPNVSNQGGQGTLTNVWSGVDYTLAENPNPGANYTASAWTCKDAQDAPVTVSAGKVQVKKGQDVTCTITNTYTAPGINVVKTADKTQVHAGDSVTYTYVVTNTGISPLSSVTLTDNKCAPVTGPVKDPGNQDNLLEPGEKWTYSCTTTLQDTTTNTATAKGKDSEQNELIDTDDETVTVLKPAIKVVKTADKAEVHAGDSVTYSYAVTTNGSATPLKDVTLTDNKCAPVTGPTKSGGNQDAWLEQGETWTYSCTTTLQDTTTNTATAKGKDNLNKEVTNTDDETVTVLKPAIKVVKTADKAEVKAGGQVTYSYAVTTNGSATPLKDVTVADDKCAPVTGPTKSGGNQDAWLEQGETWTYSCTTTLQDTTTNIATAKGKDNLNKEVTDTDTVTVTVPKPGIKVVKSADKTEVKAGGEVTYSYAVTNTGDTPLKNVSVTDDKCAPVTGPTKTGGNQDEWLEDGEVWTYTCTTTLDKTTENTAVAKGEDRTGQPVEDTDKVTVTVPKPGIKVVKSADKTEVKAGGEVTYSYAVTNTGDTPLKNVSVTDDKCAPVTGPTKTGGNQDEWLEDGEVWTYTCTTTLDKTTENTAVAKGEDRTGQPVEDTDKVTVTVPKPGIKVVKSADKTEVKAGGEVTYSYAVTNTGDTPLKNVSVTDDKCAPVTGPTKTGGNQDEWLEDGEVWTYTCTTTLDKTTENTAVAKGEDRTGQPVEDTDKVTVTVPKPGIKVVKSADKTEVKAGGQVTYTYKVTNTGDTPLKNVSVTDDKCAPVTGPVKDPGDDDEWLEDGEVWTYTCTTTLSATTENTAVAKGEDRTGQPTEDEDKVTVTVPKPGIKVAKSADKTEVKAGESVTYTYTVTNTGDIELVNVTVTDDKCAPVVYKSGDTNGDKKLQVNETWTFTCTTVLNEPTTNTALVKGEDRTGQPVENTDKVTVNVTQVSPIVAKTICPIDVTLHKPQPKKVGNKILTDKIKTKKSSCVLLKPVVLCRPLASSAAGETAFCETKVTKKGRIKVKTKGYEAVRVTAIVRTKPKPGFEDLWKPNTWRKSWKLK